MRRYLYVLELADGYFYVGVTDKPQHRLAQHRHHQYSCHWLRMHPMKAGTGFYGKLRVCTSDRAEDTEVVRLMRIHGVDKVRGGSFMQIVLSSEERRTLEKGASVGCTQTQRHNSNLCVRCGKPGHIANNCIETTDSNGKSLAHVPLSRSIPFKNINPETYEVSMKAPCYRCGRYSHWAPDCFATVHVDGRSLRPRCPDKDKALRHFACRA